MKSTVFRSSALMRNTQFTEILRFILAALFGAVLMSVVNKRWRFASCSNKTAHSYAVFDPVQNGAELEKRLGRKCNTQLPQEKDLGRNGTRKKWNRSRYVMYHNLVLYLQDRWAIAESNAALQVLDVSGSVFLDQFRADGLVNITKTSYPEVDVHNMPFPEASFDVITADQVFEHIAFPHQAMLEMHRVLRPGGIGIITTIAYNPIHMQRDYWRFNIHGLLALSAPFRSVPLCGSWGVGGAICARAKFGMGPQERVDEQKYMNDQVRRNELQNPFSTWIIVEK